MKVIVAAGICAFEEDQIANIAFHLVQRISQQKHNVELVHLDAGLNGGSRVFEQASAIKTLRVDLADHVIALGWPAHLLVHDRATVWISHRSVCCGWHAEHDPLDIKLLAEQERRGLVAAKNIFAMSSYAQNAALTSYRRNSELLPPPVIARLSDTQSQPEATEPTATNSSIDWTRVVDSLLE